MTVGERISALRREKGLSQEALGEALGVSRQAISKWESDASLPEIDKLLALSRLFSIGIGALLGVEEAESPKDGALTPEQLAMAEEIAKKYIEGAPSALPKPHRAPKLIAAALALTLLLLLFRVLNLQDAIDDLRYQNSTLQDRISSMKADMSYSLSGMTDRMEDILAKQNSLVADYGYSVKWVDYGTGDCTIELYAVPREYSEGMSGRFSAGDMQAEAEKSGERFSAELSFPLFGETPKFFVTFEKDGLRQTQHLEDVNSFSQVPYPELWLDYDHDSFDFFWRREVKELQNINLEMTVFGINGECAAAENHNALQGVKYGFGLFLNGEPIFFSSPGSVSELRGGSTAQLGSGEQPLYPGIIGTDALSLPTMDEGDTLSYILGVTDNYGHLHVSDSWSLTVDSAGILDIGKEAPDAESGEGKLLLEHLSA